MSTLFGIVGPTASGKTRLAVLVAQRVGAQIISADSMQVYTRMEVLSAQPTPEETCGIKHHLIGFVSPGEKYNASKYRLDAQKAINEIRLAGETPLLCGGSGLYVDALTRGLRLATEADAETRLRLKRIAAQPGGDLTLYRELETKDPASARKYAPQDTRRVIRSLEIFYATGRPRGEMEQRDAQGTDGMPACLFALKWERRVLYDRVNARVDEMLRRGLVDEVKRLSQAEAPVQETAAQAIGYKEIKLALDGEITMYKAIEKVKLNTRHLAKRQETWFRRDERVKWFDTDGTNLGQIAEVISQTILEDTGGRA
ncbi:MAG: tRNA (adenosine(37)-N6)-dimethylallyltransferase MiaA [Clostridiales bacterium]|nr:tRNA (adenosine(37)-N6)-dimethylallyltransferase MiaA [Clostridiales bacterium]